MTFPIVAANGPAGYNLTNSLRFRASASAYLNRTPASNGTRTTWTWSGWVKRGVLGSAQCILGGGTSGTNYFTMWFTSSDTLQVNEYQSANNVDLTTTQVFRDPAAWYHIVLAYDTTQATAANRVKLYVNGSQITALSASTYPAQNFISLINSTTTNYIAKINASYSTYYLDAYLAEVNFIDGQALTSSSFGSTNTLTGVWQPAKYTGTYGTNGFYLPFTDNSALTTSSNAGLGKDFSGNGNYWVTNNISITSGVTYDSMTDVPTLTSPTAANFCVLNPLNKSPSSTVSNGNLRQTSSGGWYRAYSTIFFASTAAFYAEATMTSLNSGSNGVRVGVANANSVFTYLGSDANSWSYDNQGGKYTNGTLSSYGASYVQGDVIGILFNNGSLTFYKNGTSQGVAYSGLTGTFCFAGSPFDTDTVDWNFGQRPFAYSLPSGALALNTYNLPTSTIVKGNTSMNAVTWSGATTGTNLNVTGFGFQPDFVWGKNRSGTYDHFLQDSVRGITNGLSSNLTAAESTTSGSPTSFIADGFNISSTAGWSSLGNSNVTWAWKAGQGTTSSNTSGTITSTVSVNASAGFSVVTFTAPNASAPQTFGHGLGVAPAFFTIKARNTTSSWQTYHTSIGATNRLLLNTTDAQTTTSGPWNNTAPTSTVITIGSSFVPDAGATTYVAYCWTPIAGYSSFGSYVGNGSTDGPFIYTGFKPRYIMMKDISAAGSWIVQDSARNPYNPSDTFLQANTTSADYTYSGANIDFVSNGFKIRGTDGDRNFSGYTYIYCAFAENPFKNSLAE